MALGICSQGFSPLRCLVFGASLPLRRCLLLGCFASPISLHLGCDLGWSLSFCGQYGCLCWPLGRRISAPAWWPWCSRDAAVLLSQFRLGAVSGSAIVLVQPSAFGLQKRRLSIGTFPQKVHFTLVALPRSFLSKAVGQW